MVSEHAGAVVRGSDVDLRPTRAVAKCASFHQEDPEVCDSQSVCAWIRSPFALKPSTESSKTFCCADRFLGRAFGADTNRVDRSRFPGFLTTTAESERYLDSPER